MTTISVAMLVKDPPLDRLAMLVDYMLPVASEFVVVDTGSSDHDKQVMAALPRVKLLEREWRDDFSWARNEGLAECTGQWTLVLDPDELPNYEWMKWMQDYILNPDATQTHIAYLTWTRNYWGGVKGPEETYHWHIRLFRTGRGRFYRPVHELVMLDGQTENKTRGNSHLVRKLSPSKYLIHSKDMPDIEKADELYRRLGEESR